MFCLCSYVLASALVEADANFSLPQQDAVVYEANFRALGADGGFRKLTSDLYKLERMGVNVLWLMPIHPVGKEKAVGPLGSPYCIADFDKINPEFGTPAEFRTLLSTAHRLGMKVILDWVANHTSWDHPWIKNHPDWYTKGADGKIIHPGGTGWLDVADLNYDNPQMRAEMIRSMKMWIEDYGIDGFRCDAADYVPLDFWKDAVGALRASTKKNLFMLAEGGNKGLYNSGFDFLFGWDFFNELKKVFKGGDATQLAKTYKEDQTEHPEGKGHLRFITNHDESAFHDPLHTTYGSQAGTQAAFVINAYYGGGPPLVYMGQESGWSKPIPIFDKSEIKWGETEAVYHWYAEVLVRYRRTQALQTGETSDFSTRDVVVFTRTGQYQQALVVVNVRNATVNVDLKQFAGSKWETLLPGSSSQPKARTSLKPFEARVYLRSIKR